MIDIIQPPRTAFEGIIEEGGLEFQHFYYREMAPFY